MINDILMLRRYRKAHEKLTELFIQKRPVHECIELIEKEVDLIDNK